MKRQQGFTLVELLFSMAILGVLGAISFQAYVDQKARAFDTYSAQLLHDAQVAAEAGIEQLNLTANDWVWSEAMGDGNLQTWLSGAVGSNDTALPGLNIKERQRFQLWYSGWCANNLDVLCVQSQVWAWHCDGNEAMLMERWNNGLTLIWEWPNWGC